MLEKAKIILRITNNAYDEEITDLINAAFLDLAEAGVTNTDDTDELIIRAVMTYVKANFGWQNNEAERLDKAYEHLKTHLTLTSTYGGDL